MKKSETSKITDWSCDFCGTPLGAVYRMNGIHILIPSSAEDIEIIGDAKIYCSNCGYFREWHWDAVAMTNLIKSVLKRSG